MKPKKIYYFNDPFLDGKNQIKRAGTRVIYNRIIHNIIRINDIYSYDYDEKFFNECDIILINGESSFHKSQEERKLFLIDILKKAHELNKKTCIINTIFDVEENFYPEVFRKVNYLAIKEIMGYDLATKMGCKPKLFSDLCNDSWFNEMPKRPLDENLRNKILYGIFNPELKKDFKKEINHDLRSPFESLKHNVTICKMYVSGEFEAIFMAGLVGIPFVPAIHENHGVKSLIKWSGLPIKICNTTKEIKEQIKWAENNPEVFKKFYKFINSLPKMTHKDWEECL